MMRERLRPGKLRKAQITVLFLGGLMTFLGMLSLTVDVGTYYATKAQLQTAADVGVLTSLAQVRPTDPIDQQERTFRETFSQFEKVNLGPAGSMGIAASEQPARDGHTFELTTTVDREKGCLVRAEARAVFVAPTSFARLFGQQTVNIGVLSTVECERVDREGSSRMVCHLVE